MRTAKRLRAEILLYVRESRKAAPCGKAAFRKSFVLPFVYFFLFVQSADFFGRKHAFLSRLSDFFESFFGNIPKKRLFSQRKNKMTCMKVKFFLKTYLTKNGFCDIMVMSEMFPSLFYNMDENLISKNFERKI